MKMKFIPKKPSSAKVKGFREKMNTPRGKKVLAAKR